MRTLPQSLERGTVLQMDKAAPQNQTFLGNIGERSPYPNILCHNYLERSIYEILQILGISLTDKTHIRDLFDKKNINDVKDLYGSSEQNLFNF